MKQFFKLPRRLATVLPTPYSSSFLNLTKDFTRSEATQSPLLTLSRNLQPFGFFLFPRVFFLYKKEKAFGKVSHLLRPIRPWFMFSAWKAEKSKNLLFSSFLFEEQKIRKALLSSNLRINLQAISLKTRTDYRLVGFLPQQQPNLVQSHPKALKSFWIKSIPTFFIYQILFSISRDYTCP